MIFEVIRLFLTKIWDFEQKKFLKKKTQALCFQKKRYTLNNLGFCIKSALKKIIVTVFEKKKIESAFCFFFSKIFFVQNLIFLSKKVVWPPKSYPRYFRRYSKDLSQEFEKKSIFVEFWWFWWKIWFSPKFWGFRG